MAKVDPLRVYVSVPQNYAPAIKNGMEAWVTLQELPGEKFKGTVARTAEVDRSLDAHLVDRSGRAQSRRTACCRDRSERCTFAWASTRRKLTIPVNAMLFRQEGPRVAVVGSDGKVHLRTIVIGKDYGTTLEILGGVETRGPRDHQSCRFA